MRRTHNIPPLVAHLHLQPLGKARSLSPPSTAIVIGRRCTQGRGRCGRPRSSCNGRRVAGVSPIAPTWSVG